MSGNGTMTTGMPFFVVVSSTLIHAHLCLAGGGRLTALFVLAGMGVEKMEEGIDLMPYFSSTAYSGFDDRIPQVCAENLLARNVTKHSLASLLFRASSGVLGACFRIFTRMSRRCR